MPRPEDVEILSQTHTFVLGDFGLTGRRVVRIVFVLRHPAPRPPSGPFTVDVPTEDFTKERAWAAIESVAAQARAI
jgi:hypothetical protein